MIRSVRRTLSSIAVALLALACPGTLPVAADDAAKSKAPNFRATDVNGEKVTLEELLEKGPVVVDFWATWCKPCLKAMPYLQRMHEQYADDGAQIVAVSIDSPKSQNQVKKVVDARGFTFLVLLDADQEILRKLQGKGSIPYTVVIDRDGLVRYQHTGYRPGDEKALEKVLVEVLGVEAAPAEEAEG